jgi:outer membrane lipoprotein-sorting protein
MICWRTAALIFLLAIGVSGCPPRPALREPPLHPVADRSPEGILASFVQRWQFVQSLRALARVTVTSAQGRVSTRQTFLWQRPTLLRLDTLSLFGQPVMSLVADGAQVAVYYPSEGTFFQGPANAATLAHILGLPLEVQEIAPLLMGYLRPPPAERVTAIDLQVDEGLYLLRFLEPGGGLVQDAWVDPDQLLPRRVIRYTPPASATVDITYSDFKFLTESFPAPQALAIWLPHVQTEVKLQFLTVEVNPALSPPVFHLSPPAGVQSRPLP